MKTWLDRDEAVQAIRNLSEDDLIFLNTQIIERLKLIAQAQSTVELSRFSLGDQVSFQGPGGKKIQGTVIKLNKKTAGVQTPNGRQWKVSPSLLSHCGKTK
ncbi:MAG: hypothetical protein AB8C95_08240 [Phycisphaeraceae bacterium]